jgi:hypothetical protein
MTERRADCAGGGSFANLLEGRRPGCTRSTFGIGKAVLTGAMFYRVGWDVGAQLLIGGLLVGVLSSEREGECETACEGEKFSHGRVVWILRRAIDKVIPSQQSGDVFLLLFPKSLRIAR